MSTTAGVLSPASILSIIELSSSLSELKQSHAFMLKTGLSDSSFASARLVSAVAFEDLVYANSIFSCTTKKNAFAWNTMIRAYRVSGRPESSLEFFCSMLRSHVFPDKFTYPFVLKACTALLALGEVLQIHARVIKTGFDLDVFVNNSLIHAYAISGRMDDAVKLLDKMPERDVVSWNAIISACVAQGLIERARELFDEMTERSIETWNFMVTGYLNLGLVERARELFDRMPARDVVSWNAMITGYVDTGFYSKVLDLFQIMLSEDVKPDYCTLVNVLTACARMGALGQGDWIHAYIGRNKIEVEGFLATALVDMYSKCGNIERALDVFSSTEVKDISTWNAMIEGLCSHGFAVQALEVFEKMQVSGHRPNEVTFVSLLSACSHGGFLREGCHIFNNMREAYEIEPNVKHYGCMVDLLGRAGKLEEAQELLSQAPLEVNNSPVVLEALLSAFRSHGDSVSAEMVGSKLVEMSHQGSSSYIQLSNLYASAGRWDDATEIRQQMRARGVRKDPGCSTIDINGVVHEFFASD